MKVIKKNVLVTVTLLSLSCQKIYLVDGTYMKQSAQGMSVFKDNAYLFNNTGLCRVYNLKQKLVVDSFALASAGKNNHANCASFGVEKAEGGNLPVLYISECEKPHRCFVESISNGRSKLVQTIVPKSSGVNSIAHDWIVDKSKKNLYSVGIIETIDKETYKRVHRIIKYRLPKLAEGSIVILNNNDIIDSFDIVFSNVLQGGIIEGKYMYLPVGKHGKNGKRTIIVVDLESKNICRQIDISHVNTNEPEDCDFYKGKLLLFSGQTGGLTKINK